MQTVLSILKQIEQTSSRNDKEAILKQHKDNELLKQILEYTYNPYKVYGIGAKAFKKLIDKHQSRFLNIIELLDYLLQHNTGTDQDKLEVNKFLSQYDEDTQDWYKRIILKDLKIGATEKSINKVFPNLIPVFNVMLAEPFERLFDEVAIEPKSDGVRCTAIKQNGKTSLYTRNGKNIEGFNEILNQLNSLDADNVVFDGELIGKNYKDTMEKVFKKSTNKEANYEIFDILPLNEFLQGESTKTYKERRLELASLAADAIHKNAVNIQVMESSYLSNPSIEQLNEYMSHYIERGYEGIMVKNANGKYKCKRTYDWQKMKPFFSDEFKIIGFEEGEGKYKGTLGKVIIDVNGVAVGVGSGFTDEERKEIWNNQDKYLGMQIEVQYQEKIAKTGSLRFPTVKSIRFDK